jgi:transposase InsO family protein
LLWEDGQLTLNQLKQARGVPRVLFCDNGSKFTSQAMDLWAYQNGVKIDFSRAASASRDRERASRQNIVATLRLRIKTLDAKNRELTGLLELAYGELALAREKNASVGIAF